MQQLNLIIAGSRDITNTDYILDRIQHYLQNYKEDNITILSGNARGIDKIGELYAKNHNIKCNIYPADWTTFGKSAGYKRNITMSKNANSLLAFWNGQSKGTKHMIDIAKQNNLKVKIVIV